MKIDFLYSVYTHPPSGMHNACLIMGYNYKIKRWQLKTAECIQTRWKKEYTAWYDPQIDSDIIPVEYRVEEGIGNVRVMNSANQEVANVYIRMQVNDDLERNRQIAKKAAQKVADYLNEVGA